MTVKKTNQKKGVKSKKTHTPKKRSCQSNSPKKIAYEEQLELPIFN